MKYDLFGDLFGRVLRYQRIIVTLVFLLIVVAFFLVIWSMSCYLFVYYHFLVPPASEFIRKKIDLKYSMWQDIYAIDCIEPFNHPNVYDWTLNLLLPQSSDIIGKDFFTVKLMLLPPNVEDLIPLENFNLMTRQQMHQLDLVQSRAYFLKKLNLHDLNQLELYSVVGERVVLPYWISPLYLRIRVFLLAIPRMFASALGMDWFEEWQRIRVTLIESHLSSQVKEQPDSPDMQCWALIFDHPDLRIYDASFEISVRLSGWRYVCFYWFWTCFLMGSMLIFWWNAMVLGLIGVCWYLRSSRSETVMESSNLESSQKCSME